MKPIDTFKARGFNRVPQVEGMLPRYLATRSHYPNVPARMVLQSLRAGAPVYPVLRHHSWPRHSPYNPRMSDGRRWIEDTTRAGLRFVGYADELARLNHTGWYTDDDGMMETARGAVWQLPARDGRALYVSGMCDPCNDGAALIDFADYVLGARYDEHDEQAKCEAAIHADGIAERYAEDEREYQRKFNARGRVECLRSDICDWRRKHTALVRAIWTGERDDAIGVRLREECRDAVAACHREINSVLREHGDDVMALDY